jgi:phosphoribosylformylglycinamidine (FGAM) synthase-like amidotransferase family enzyme
MAAVLKIERDVMYREIKDFKIAAQTQKINGSVKIIAKVDNKKGNISLHFLAFVMYRESELHSNFKKWKTFFNGSVKIIVMYTKKQKTCHYIF